MTKAKHSAADNQSARKIILRAGLKLGLCATALTYLLGFTGWYKDPNLLWIFYLIIPIQAIILIKTFQKTAKLDHNYQRQVLNGLYVSFLGGLIAMVFAFLFTYLFFPNYFAEIASIGQSMLTSNSPTDLQKMVADYQLMAQPENKLAASIGYAASGLMGSVASGLIFSLCLAFFIRKKA